MPRISGIVSGLLRRNLEGVTHFEVGGVAIEFRVGGGSLDSRGCQIVIDRQANMTSLGQ
jgi:hypothetical protein